MHFEKIHACGNDFVLLNSVPNRKQIEAICNRHHGLGADGIMSYELRPDGTRLEHVDPDGSFSYCLNGIRAAIGCLTQKKLIPGRGIVTMGSQQVPYHVKDSPWLFLEKAPYTNRELTCSEGLIKGFFIDVGNPHFVILNEDLQRFRKAAPSIRRHPSFPEGTNVHLVNKTQETNYIYSYERGVEGFTLSCGSGSLAAACLFFQKYHAEHITFTPEGGGSIQFEATGPLVSLHGDVSWVATGDWRC